MTPTEALDRAILRGLVDSVRTPVGQIVGRANAEVREALSRLRPEHVARPRMDLYLEGMQRRRGRFNMKPVAPVRRPKRGRWR